MNKKYIVVTIVVVMLVLLGALFMRRGTSSAPLPTKMQVVTSFYPLYFFTSQIAGNRADVSVVTPAGAEPHDYEPTAQDIATIERSRVLVLNGADLEAWGEDVKKNIDPTHTLVVTAGEKLITQEVIEDGEKIADPHVWLSPILAQQMVDAITDALIQVDTDGTSYYKANADALKTKLATLDAEYTQGLMNCKTKDIVTSHAAFGYLASNYHLTQIPISGLSPDAEPSPHQLIDIAQFAKSHHIHYIFFESLVSPKLSQTVAAEIGAQTLVLNPIEGLTDKEVAAGKDYFSVMRENLKNLRIALQCTL